MCLLCVMEPNNTPTREQLMTAASNNPHGYGYAFMTNDRIITGRGMDAEEVIDRFLRIREGFPNAWAMFHARYTTHGSTDKSNCHPFRVGGDESIVLAHNGILPIDLPKGEKRSDTRIFAEDMLPDYLTWLDDPDGWDMLEEWVGSSKVAVFSLDERLQSNVYILNESYGHWTDGIWWSNDGYKPSKWSNNRWGSLWDSDDSIGAYTSGSFSKTEWWKRQSDQSCIYCNSKLTDNEWEWGYCDFCKSCLECAQDIIDCECYNTPKDRIDSKNYKHWWEEEAFSNTKPLLRQIEA